MHNFILTAALTDRAKFGHAAESGLRRDYCAIPAGSQVGSKHGAADSGNA